MFARPYLPRSVACGLGSDRKGRKMENKEICMVCEGRCCKALPGGYHPDDIPSLSVDYIARQLRSGKWAVDCWDDDVNVYFLRPATATGNKVMDKSWGGRCKSLSDRGCCLAHDDRPKMCRDLVPDAAGDCPGPSKYAEAMWWINHQELLLESCNLARSFANAKC